MKDRVSISGRGAQIKVSNRFFQHNHEILDEFLEHCNKEGEEADSNKTKFLDIYPKSIVNEVKSPDVGMMYSMNPYQGCEHGCIYCYARNTHEFWGYGPGLEFERNILVKKEASKLLEHFIKRKAWKAKTIVMSGNTDCYQPIEKRAEITKQCLEVFWNYRHPVGIITKNAMVLRDLPILKKLANENLVMVNISLTTLSEKTRRALEPRTATIKKRLNTIKTLADNGIPVNVMLAPIIPSINSHEILNMIKVAANHGASSVVHTVVRLNGPIGMIFTDWITKTYPDRAQKVLHQIENCHGGSLNDSRFGKRIRGEGNFADQINQQMKIGRRKYLNGKKIPELNMDLHELYKSNQLKLF